MGGRNDDAKKTPKQNRKRPLSAVIEEHEVSDSDHKSDNNNNNRHRNNVVSNAHTEQRTDLHDVGACNTSGLTPQLNLSVKQHGEINGSSESSYAEASTSQPSSVRIENGGVPSVGSPKPSRSSRFGRRLAVVPNVSPKLSHRGNFGLSPLSSFPLDIINDVDTSTLPSDLTRLKQTAERLQLSTRRPSFMQWRATYVESPQFPVRWEVSKGDHSETTECDNSWTPERTNRINSALDWLKNELVSALQFIFYQLIGSRKLNVLFLLGRCKKKSSMFDCSIISYIRCLV